MNYLKLVLIFFLTIQASADVCSNWFLDSKIQTADKKCLSKCNIYPVDMSSFSCHSQCEKFCKKTECKNNFDWESKIKNGRPTKWDFETEKTKSWTNTETKKLVEVFNSLPAAFSTATFKGFYRMDRSIQGINPATTSPEKLIVLYDYAFKHPLFKTDRVITHELAHIIYLNFSVDEKRDYMQALGWNETPTHDFTRSGPYLSQDANGFPEEDFAINIEFFLFENDKVKKQLPKAYKWIIHKFTNDFNLKEVCHEN